MASARCPQPRSVALAFAKCLRFRGFSISAIRGAYVRRGELTTPRRSPKEITMDDRRKISPSSPMPILTAIPLRAIARRFGRISKTSSRHKSTRRLPTRKP